MSLPTVCSLILPVPWHVCFAITDSKKKQKPNTSLQGLPNIVTLCVCSRVTSWEQTRTQRIQIEHNKCPSGCLALSCHLQVMQTLLLCAFQRVLEKHTLYQSQTIKSITISLLAEGGKKQKKICVHLTYIWPIQGRVEINARALHLEMISNYKPIVYSGIFCSPLLLSSWLRCMTLLTMYSFRLSSN